MLKIDKLNFSTTDITTRFIEKINRNEYFVRWGLDNMEIERWYDHLFTLRVSAQKWIMLRVEDLQMITKSTIRKV